MFLEINGIDRNVYMIASIIQDGNKLIYKMQNGTQLQEEFSTEQEATDKYNEAIEKGIGIPLEDGKIPAEYLPSYVDDIVDLIAVDSVAPASCAEGDMYYNTTSKLIYTATGTNTWGTNGEVPEGSKIYLDISANPALSYRWSGTDLVEVGQDLSNYMTLDSAQIVTGTKTFSVLPESAVTPTTNNQLVNKKYVDDNVGGNIYLGKWSDYNSAANKLDLSSLKKGTYTIFLDDGYYLYLGSESSERIYNPVRNYNGTPFYFMAVLNILKNKEDWGNNEVIAKLDAVQFLPNLSASWDANIRHTYYDIQYNTTTEKYLIDEYASTAKFIRQDDSSINNVSTPINFTTLPASSVVPTTDNQLVNKKYVDDNAGGGGGYSNIFSSDVNSLNNDSATKTKLAEFITNNKNKTVFIFVASSSTGNYTTNGAAIFKMYIRGIFSNVTYRGVKISGSPYGETYQSGNILDISTLSVVGTWSDNVFTISSVEVMTTSQPDCYISTSNAHTQVYTPTQPYNPATKKYVDDTINNKIWIGTQAEYDALGSYSDSTVYFIKENTNAS